MAIQMRRGKWERFDKSKLLAGEFAVVASGDPDSSDGSAAYLSFGSGKVKRMATIEDAVAAIENKNGAVISALTEEIEGDKSAMESAAAAATEAATRANAAANVADEAVSAYRQYAKALPHGTAEGTVATCDLSADFPLQAVNIAGATVQNLWPVISSSTSSNGVVYTVGEDGSIKASGTAVGTAFSNSVRIKNVKPSTAYTMSGTSGDVRVHTVQYDKDGNILANLNGDKTFTTSASIYELSCNVYVASGTTVDATVYPMLVEGSEAQPFTPCGRITSVEGVETVTTTGKNLAQMDVGNNLGLSSKSEEISFAGSARTKMITVVAGEKYTVSWAGTGTIFALYYNNKGEFMPSRKQTSAKTWTLTIPNGVAYLRLSFLLSAGGTGTPYGNKPQLELGTTATAYEPYQATPTAITLPEGEFAGSLPDGTTDYVEVKDGEDWLNKTTKKIVLDGSITTVNKDSTSGDYTVWLYSSMGTTARIGYCDRLPLGSGINAESVLPTVDGHLYLKLLTSHASTVSELNTYLKNNPVTVVVKCNPNKVALGAVSLPDGVYGTTNVWAENEQGLSQAVEVDYIQDGTLALQALRDAIVESATV